jgi:hypothetical protein
MGLHIAESQQPGAIGKPQDRLIMANLDVEVRSQSAQEGIHLAWPCQPNLHSSILQPAWIVADLASESMGQQLVAVANAQDGDTSFNHSR